MLRGLLSSTLLVLFIALQSFAAACSVRCATMQFGMVSDNTPGAASMSDPSMASSHCSHQMHVAANQTQSSVQCIQPSTQQCPKTLCAGIRSALLPKNSFEIKISPSAYAKLGIRMFPSLDHKGNVWIVGSTDFCLQSTSRSAGPQLSEGRNFSSLRI